MANKNSSGTVVRRVKASSTETDSSAARTDEKSAKTAKAVSRPAKPSKSPIKRNQKPTLVKSGKKPFFLLRPIFAIGRYFRDSWRELRQVRWTNRRATWTLTLAVILFTAFFMIFVLLFDWVFQWLIKEVIL